MYGVKVKKILPLLIAELLLLMVVIGGGKVDGDDAPGDF